MTKQLDWLELAIDAAENARKLRVSGNDPRADDWDDVAAARAAVAQAEALIRLVGNSDRIADALQLLAYEYAETPPSAGQLFYQNTDGLRDETDINEAAPSNGWRPRSDPPQADGVYLAWRRGYVNLVVREKGCWFEKFSHWHPLPPPPGEEPTP